MLERCRYHDLVLPPTNGSPRLGYLLSPRDLSTTSLLVQEVMRTPRMTNSILYYFNSSHQTKTNMTFGAYSSLRQ
jgi:hypothetical protein